MLEELRIHNFAIIDQLELSFATGLNVITGETGAGKSIIIDAVELLLGGKADASFVRSGAERAVVEGVFTLNERAAALIVPVLQREELIDDDQLDALTLTREVRSNGRSTARINGVTVNLDVLSEIGDLLVDVHGQSEHLSLLKPASHIDLLDRYADLMDARAALASVVSRLNDARAEIHHLLADEAALARRAELLTPTLEEMRLRLRLVSDWMAQEPLLDWVKPSGGVACFPHMREMPPGGTGAFYKRLLGAHGTYVGPGHWFEMPDTHFRLGYGWTTRSELEAGLDGISKALRGE